MGALATLWAAQAQAASNRPAPAFASPDQPDDRTGTGIGGFFGNVAADVGDLVGGLFGLVGTGVSELWNQPTNVMKEFATLGFADTPVNVLTPALVPHMGEAIVSDVKDRYLEGDTAQELYDHPLSFLLDATAIAGAAGATARGAAGLGGVYGRIGKAVLRPETIARNQGLLTLAREARIARASEGIETVADTARRWASLAPNERRTGEWLDRLITEPMRVADPHTGAVFDVNPTRNPLVRAVWSDPIRRKYFVEGLPKFEQEVEALRALGDDIGPLEARRLAGMETALERMKLGGAQYLARKTYAGPMLARRYRTKMADKVLSSLNLRGSRLRTQALGSLDETMRQLDRLGVPEEVKADIHLRLEGLDDGKISSLQMDVLDERVRAKGFESVADAAARMLHRTEGHELLDVDERNTLTRMFKDGKIAYDGLWRYQPDADLIELPERTRFEGEFRGALERLGMPAQQQDLAMAAYDSVARTVANQSYGGDVDAFYRTIHSEFAETWQQGVRDELFQRTNKVLRGVVRKRADGKYQLDVNRLAGFMKDATPDERHWYRNARGFIADVTRGGRHRLPDGRVIRDSELLADVLAATSIGVVPERQLGMALQIYSMIKDGSYEMNVIRDRAGLAVQIENPWMEGPEWLTWGRAGPNVAQLVDEIAHGHTINDWEAEIVMNGGDLILDDVLDRTRRGYPLDMNDRQKVRAYAGRLKGLDPDIVPVIDRRVSLFFGIFTGDSVWETVLGPGGARRKAEGFDIPYEVRGARYRKLGDWLDEARTVLNSQLGPDELPYTMEEAQAILWHRARDFLEDEANRVRRKIRRTRARSHERADLERYLDFVTASMTEAMDSTNYAKAWTELKKTRYGDKIARALRREISDPREFAQRVADEIKGSTIFGPDFSKLVRFYRTGDFTTVVHELGHVIRRSMPREMSDGLWRTYFAQAHGNAEPGEIFTEAGFPRGVVAPGQVEPGELFQGPGPPGSRGLRPDAEGNIPWRLYDDGTAESYVRLKRADGQNITQGQYVRYKGKPVRIYKIGSDGKAQVEPFGEATTPARTDRTTTITEVKRRADGRWVTTGDRIDANGKVIGKVRPQVLTDWEVRNELQTVGNRTVRVKRNLGGVPQFTQKRRSVPIDELEIESAWAPETFGLSEPIGWAEGEGELGVSFGRLDYHGKRIVAGETTVKVSGVEEGTTEGSRTVEEIRMVPSIRQGEVGTNIALRLRGGIGHIDANGRPTGWYPIDRVVSTKAKKGPDTPIDAQLERLTGKPKEEIAEEVRPFTVRTPKGTEVRELVSPLEYKTRARVKRLQVDLPNRTFADKRYHPGTVAAFIDFTETADGGVFIHYISTADEVRGRGFASELVGEIYRRYDGEVDWGKVMDPAAGRIFERYKDDPATAPRTRGRDWYSTTKGEREGGGKVTEKFSGRDKDVEIGAKYRAKVGDKIRTIRIIRENPHGGWDALNTETGRDIRIRSGRRLRERVPEPSETMTDTEAEAALADLPEKARARIEKDLARREIEQQQAAGEAVVREFGDVEQQFFEDDYLDWAEQQPNLQFIEPPEVARLYVAERGDRYRAPAEEAAPRARPPGQGPSTDEIRAAPIVARYKAKRAPFEWEIHEIEGEWWQVGPPGAGMLRVHPQATVWRDLPAEIKRRYEARPRDVQAEQAVRGGISEEAEAAAQDDFARRLAEAAGGPEPVGAPGEGVGVPAEAKAAAAAGAPPPPGFTPGPPELPPWQPWSREMEEALAEDLERWFYGRLQPQDPTALAPIRAITDQLIGLWRRVRGFVREHELVPKESAEVFNQYLGKMFADIDSPVPTPIAGVPRRRRQIPQAANLAERYGDGRAVRQPDVTFVDADGKEKRRRMNADELDRAAIPFGGRLTRELGGMFGRRNQRVRIKEARKVRRALSDGLRVLDAVGARVMVDSWPAVDRAVDQIAQGMDVVGVEDTRRVPGLGGHRGVRVYVRDPDSGMIGEIEVGTPFFDKFRTSTFEHDHLLTDKARIVRMLESKLARMGSNTQADATDLEKLARDLDYAKAELSAMDRYMQGTYEMLADDIAKGYGVQVPDDQLRSVVNELRLWVMRELEIPYIRDNDFDPIYAFERQFLPLRIRSGAEWQEGERLSDGDWVGGDSASKIDDERAAAGLPMPVYFPHIESPGSATDLALAATMQRRGQGHRKMAENKNFRRNRGILFQQGTYITDVQEAYSLRAARGIKHRDTYEFVAQLTKQLGRMISDKDDLLPGEVIFAPDFMQAFVKTLIGIEDRMGALLSQMDDTDLVVAFGELNAKLGRELSPEIVAEGLRATLNVQEREAGALYLAVAETIPKVQKQLLTVSKRGVELYALPRDVANRLYESARWQFGDRVRIFWDKPTQFWRAVTLYGRPAWVINNLLGSTLFAKIGGVKVAEIVHAAMDNEYSWYVDQLAERFGDETIELGFTESATYPVHLGATEDRKMGQAIANLENRARKSKWTAPARMWGQFFKRVNTDIENAYRRIGFVEGIRKSDMQRNVRGAAKTFWGSKEELTKMLTDGVTPARAQSAMDSMNTLFGDYATMTPVERGVVRRFIAPFWGFYRHMIKLLVKMPFDYPLKTSIMRAMSLVNRDLREEYGPVPEWMDGMVPFGPMSQDGMQRFLSVSGPNPFNIFMDTGLSLLHPIIKSVFEQATGRDAYTGREFSDPDVFQPFGSDDRYRIIRGVNGVPIDAVPVEKVVPGPGVSLLSNFPQYDALKQLVAGGRTYDTLGILGAAQEGPITGAGGEPIAPYSLGEFAARQFGASVYDYDVAEYRERLAQERENALMQAYERWAESQVGSAVGVG